MSLSIQQINELNVGTSLAAELIGENGKRKFIHVGSYTKDSYGSKSIKGRKLYATNRIWYSVAVYSILPEYIDMDLEIGSDDIIYHLRVSDIKEICDLENCLKENLKDLSLLRPSWYCDDIL